MDMQAAGARGGKREAHHLSEVGDADREWQDALAIVERDLDEEALEEAHEVYLAEAARIRLRDRRGHLRLVLRCGAEVVGDVGSDDPIAGHLLIVEAGRTHVIAEWAITMVTGSQVRLRIDEETSVDGGVRSALTRMKPAERSLTSWLREVWIEGRRVEAMTASGSLRAGSVTFVGADHVELSGSDSEPVVLPLAAVDVWSVLA